MHDRTPGSLIGRGCDMKHWRRVQQAETLRETLARLALAMRERAEALPAGVERDQLLKQARNADTTAHLDDWVSSPGLRPPT
ncbi:hypothetical protein AOQ71_38315 [Bradyrhizobium manausense]|uniref:Uncharacterized protein n=1 Tax=Bradyrhizobium manausense TaxID=989370 RepID=A0A0R3CT08_9BRAD|nr:hypothetical protein AOQ71_38315 [Bradyrhizobium manausense]